MVYVVLVSHPSTYCGRAYNVPLHYNEDRLCKYIHEVTKNASYAKSFAFRRLIIESTGLASTTVEWAALSDAADFVCNVQLPSYANGDPLGIEWRVATKGTRLPDILKTAGIPVHAAEPPGSNPAPPVRNSYASIVAGASQRAQPVATAGTPTMPSVPPTSSVIQPVPQPPPAETTMTALLQQMLQMQKDQNDRAERRELAQNVFNTKLLDRMNDMMKSSIDQFTKQMQVFHSVLVKVDGRLTTVATQQSVDILQQSVNTLQQRLDTLVQTVTGSPPPPPPAAAQPAPSTRRGRPPSSSPRGRRRTQSVARSVPPQTVVTADRPAADTDPSLEPSPDSEVSPDAAASSIQLTYSLSSTTSSASDTTQVLAPTPILRSLSSSDDTSSELEDGELHLSSTDTNNVTRHTAVDSDGDTAIASTSSADACPIGTEQATAGPWRY